MSLRFLNMLLRIVLIGTLFLFSGCKRSDQTDQSASLPPVIKTKLGLKMILLPAGSFMMGSDQGNSDEKPVHQVQLDAFLMDHCEVTQALFQQITLENPSHYKGPQFPVEQISWARAVLFCNARSRAEGLEPCYDEDTGQCNFQADGYRLPTEAEWEYACRAGSNRTYFFGNNTQRLKEYAWTRDTSSKKTHPVGTKTPNPWGLYDMLGNVAEWCNDYYVEDYYQHSPQNNPTGPTGGVKQVLRGGAYNSTSNPCRSSYRQGEFPGQIDSCFARDDIGFRCVRKAPDTLLSSKEP